MRCKTGATTFPDVFKRVGVRPSGPGDFRSFKLESWRNTSLWEIWIFPKEGIGSSHVAGTDDKASVNVEKTDWKKRSKLLCNVWWLIDYMFITCQNRRRWVTFPWSYIGKETFRLVGRTDHSHTASMTRLPHFWPYSVLVCNCSSQLNYSIVELS